MQITGVSTWAALSTSGLKRLVLPHLAQRITIACDNDPAGLDAATDVAEKWTKEDKLAYWMNTYNAFTIKLIIDNYPTKSINDIAKPWDKKHLF